MVFSQNTLAEDAIDSARRSAISSVRVYYAIEKSKIDVGELLLLNFMIEGLIDAEIQFCDNNQRHDSKLYNDILKVNVCEAGYAYTANKGQIFLGQKSIGLSNLELTEVLIHEAYHLAADKIENSFMTDLSTKYMSTFRHEAFAIRMQFKIMRATHGCSFLKEHIGYFHNSQYSAAIKKAEVSDLDVCKEH